MKAKEMRERTPEELVALEKEISGQVFDHRFKNFTNRLDDTSLIRKTRRDLARVKTLLAQQAKKALAMAKQTPKGKKGGGGKAPAAASNKDKTAAAVKGQSVPPPAPVAAAEVKAPVTPTAPVKAHSFRRKLVGRVTSDKMNKTVVVEVRRSSRDRVYKKYVQSRAKYKAHDENNEYKVGDRVEIQEHRPISREKRWKVVRLVARPVLELGASHDSDASRPGCR
jgi:small subunit ribosomal protein S17